MSLKYDLTRIFNASTVVVSYDDTFSSAMVPKYQAKYCSRNFCSTLLAEEPAMPILDGIYCRNTCNAQQST
jgi:hypothetical protein